MKRRPAGARDAQRKAEADAMFAFYNDGPGELLVGDESEQKPTEPAKPLKVSEEERARLAKLKTDGAE